MSRKKLALNLIFISSLLFGCSNSTSSSEVVSSVVSSITSEEVISVAKEAIDSYSDTNIMKVYTNNLNLNANAVYTQTKNKYVYGVELDNISMDLESENIKNIDENATYLCLNGSFSTDDSSYYNNVLDEEESKQMNIKFENEEALYKENTLYLSLSNTMNKQISNDDTKQGCLKVYKTNISSLFNDGKELVDEKLSLINPADYIDPSAILDTLTNNYLIKNYLNYTYNGQYYSIGTSLKMGDIYSIINNYSNSYAEKLTLDDNCKFNLSINFDSEKIIGVDIDANVIATLNFGSKLGKVVITYIANGNIYYDDNISKIATFNTDGYTLIENCDVNIEDYYNNIVDSLKNIYKEVIAFI